MGETRRKFDQDFKEGAVRLVRETGKPVAQVARDLGSNEGTLGNWVNANRRRWDGAGPGEFLDERGWHPVAGHVEEAALPAGSLDLPRDRERLRSHGRLNRSRGTRSRPGQQGHVDDRQRRGTIRTRYSPILPGTRQAGNPAMLVTMTGKYSHGPGIGLGARSREARLLRSALLVIWLLCRCPGGTTIGLSPGLPRAARPSPCGAAKRP